MNRQPKPQPNCSIARTLDLVGDRWTFLILREAHLGATRFAEVAFAAEDVTICEMLNKPVPASVTQALHGTTPSTALAHS